MAENRLFSAFIEQMMPHLIVPATSRGLLDAFCSPDVTSEKVAQYLKANPYYEDQVLKRVESLKGGEVNPETPKVEASIVLLGMQNTRNLILSMQAIRAVRGAHPDWGKDGKKLAYQPADILKYSIRTEEALVAEKDADPGTAFAAGYLFDLVALLAVEKIQDKKLLGEVQALLEAVFVSGLQSAKVAMQLGRTLPGFSLRKYLFAGALVHGIGKPLMAMVEPAYAAFDKTCAEKKLPNLVRVFAERERFGVNHEVLGTMACSGLGVLKTAEKAILFQGRPHLLKAAKPKLHQLASLIRLAANMTQNPQKPDKEDDPVLVQWKSPEIRDLKLTNAHLMNASKKLA